VDADRQALGGHDVAVRDRVALRGLARRDQARASLVRLQHHGGDGGLQGLEIVLDLLAIRRVDLVAGEPQELLEVHDGVAITLGHSSSARSLASTLRSSSVEVSPSRLDRPAATP
jgi:hypothetical protein